MSEDHKTITAQEEIRSQTVIKEMSLSEATKRSNNLEKLYQALITISPHQWNQRVSFQSRDYLSQNSETD